MMRGVLKWVGIIIGGIVALAAASFLWPLALLAGLILLGVALARPALLARVPGFGGAPRRTGLIVGAVLVPLAVVASTGRAPAPVAAPVVAPTGTVAAAAASQPPAAAPAAPTAAPAKPTDVPKPAATATALPPTATVRPAASPTPVPIAAPTAVPTLAPTATTRPPTATPISKPIVDFTGKFEPRVLRIGQRITMTLTLINKSDQSFETVRLFGGGPWDKFTIISVGPAGRVDKGIFGWNFRFAGGLAAGETKVMTIVASPNEPGNHELTFIPNNGETGQVIDADGSNIVIGGTIAVTR